MFGLDIIGGSIIEGIKGYFQRKQELKKAELEAEKIKINAEAEIKKAEALNKMKLAEQGQLQDFSLDKIAIENMNKSWKDEFIMLIFFTPIIMAFIPTLTEYTLQGFETIKQLPQWYMYIIVGMVITIYGLRGLLRELIKNKKGVL